MESTKGREMSKGWKFVKATVFGISVMALVLLFSIGVGKEQSGAAESAGGSETLQASTSAESYESDSVTRPDLPSVEASQSDSIHPEQSSSHPELILQLD